jgi:hypothetical protein
MNGPVSPTPIRSEEFIMASALLSEHAAARVQEPAPRRIPDDELALLLADLRPAPHRAPELVALRATALGLTPTPRPARFPYRVWPILITLGATGGYVVAGVVLR